MKQAIVKGRVYGRLTLQERLTGKERLLWTVLCECGEVEKRNPSNLQQTINKGRVAECGLCSARRVGVASARNEKQPFEVGDKFGTLELVRCIVEGTQKTTQWLVQCICGRRERRHPEQLRGNASRGKTPRCDRCSLRVNRVNPTRNIARNRDL